MRRPSTVVHALAVVLALASVQSAAAQRVARNMYQNRGPTPPAGVAAPPAEQYVEELPATRDRAPNGHPRERFAEPGPHGFHPHGHHPPVGYPGGGYPGGWHDDFWMDSGCGVPSSSFPQMGGVPGGQFFFTADYLRVRAGFSDATSFIDRQFVNGTTTFDFNQMDFDFRSSYRFGGGYRLAGCGEEFRFLHTRMRSSHESEFISEAIPGIGFRQIIPFKPPQFPGGRVEIDADVDVKSFDWEWAKTIPLGGKACCDCGDFCGGGCADCAVPCVPVCPTWDITWSAGVRYAEADWHRRWRTFGPQDLEIGGTLSTMDFRGVGAKVGFEGRRYFFQNGWLSTYAKGDLSLLWGRLDFDLQHRDELDLPTQILVSNRIRQIIPVTELEAGVTAQATSNARFSAGYLLSAWHDLGFRDDFVDDLTFPILYDDANILGFHGWFLRAEIAY